MRHKYPLGNIYDGHCSAWVRLDGFQLIENGVLTGSDDVLQAGIHMHYNANQPPQRMPLYPPIFNPNFYVWVEWFPEDEKPITNLPIAFGDWMSIIIMYENKANDAYFNIFNDTAQIRIVCRHPAPVGRSLVGDTAEWVVERPKVNGQVSALAPYGSLSLLECGGMHLSKEYSPQNIGNSTLYQLNMTENNFVVSQAGLMTQLPRDTSSNIWFLYSI